MQRKVETKAIALCTSQTIPEKKLDTGSINIETHCNIGNNDPKVYRCTQYKTRNSNFRRIAARLETNVIPIATSANTKKAILVPERKIVHEGNRCTGTTMNR